MAGAHSGPTGPVSLLFTPTSLKTGDGSRTPDLRGGLRSPRASGSLFGQQASRGPRWDATPAQTRRRSLTPSSSGLARETPPPPPTSSLMDESPGGGEAGTGPAPMDTCSPGRADADAGALRPAPQPAPYAGCWVTTFGFGPEDLPDVLRELGRCGDLLHWGTYGDGQGVNWLHMKFATPQGAQRALLRDGSQVSSSVIIGVRAVDASRQAELDEAAEGRAGREAAATGRPAVTRKSLAPTQYVAPAPVQPLPARSPWTKLYEAVWGL
ncbi:NUP53 [Auxenochlorella protothecoides x Auxenochlorella symbiontica]